MQPPSLSLPHRGTGKTTFRRQTSQTEAGRAPGLDGRGRVIILVTSRVVTWLVSRNPNPSMRV